MNIEPLLAASSRACLRVEAETGTSGAGVVWGYLAGPAAKWVSSSRRARFSSLLPTYNAESAREISPGPQVSRQCGESLGEVPRGIGEGHEGDPSSCPQFPAGTAGRRSIRPLALHPCSVRVGQAAGGGRIV